MKHFEVFHQRCLRRILKIKWFHRLRNADVLKQAQITSAETIISAMRLRWYGHVVRMPETGYVNSWLTANLIMARGHVGGYENHGRTV